MFHKSRWWKEESASEELSVSVISMSERERHPAPRRLHLEFCLISVRISPLLVPSFSLLPFFPFFAFSQLPPRASPAFPNLNSSATDNAGSDELKAPAYVVTESGCTRGTVERVIEEEAKYRGPR